MVESTFPFTHDMVVVHRAFRREFGQASTWVRRVVPGDTAQAARVYQYLQTLFNTLHHHHEAEDIELWPRLRARASAHQALLDEMETQHSGIDPALAEARVLGQRWAASADVESREAFADRLDALQGPLMAHLAQEEAEILPLAQEHLTEAEWGLLAKHATTHTPKAELLKGIGGLLEDATPQERQMMLEHLPAVAKVLYRLVGRRAYIREVTAVRGAAPVGL